MRTDMAIEAAGVLDRRDERTVLDGVDLRVAAGSWTALLGPNGAGKSTLLRLLAGLRQPVAGALILFGDPAENLSRRQRAALIGYVPQSIACHMTLTARENLVVFGEAAALRGSVLRERIDWALDWAGLHAAARREVRTLSGGMARRLNLACAILHRPPLILLDEPTEGIDAEGRARLWAMLAELRRAGSTILHCSHHFEDVEAHCDAAVVMRAGRVVAAGSVAELLRDHAPGGGELRLSLQGPAPARLPAPLREDAHGIGARLANPAHELPRLLADLAALGLSPRELHLRAPGLREACAALAGTQS
jgi:ABC-2 type transport system ATP-binding protein